MRYIMIRIILCTIIAYQNYGGNHHLAHHALEDVKAMQQICCSEALSLLLNQLTIQSRKQIVTHWQQKYQSLPLCRSMQSNSDKVV